MKNLTLYFFIGLLLFACNAPQSRPEETERPALVSAVSDQATKFLIPSEGLGSAWEVQSNGINVSLATVSKAVYEKAIGLKKNQLLDATKLHATVQQKDACWQMSPESGPEKMLCPSEEEQIINVTYKGYNQGLNACVFMQDLLESTPMISIINPTNGEVQNLRGSAFHLSPSGTYLVTLGNDRIDWVGFDVHAISEGKLTDVAINNMEEPPYKMDDITFEPNALVWVSDKEAYVYNECVKEPSLGTPTYYRIFIKEV